MLRCAREIWARRWCGSNRLMRQRLPGPRASCSCAAKIRTANLNPIPVNFYAGPRRDPFTDWVSDRNDPYLRGWVVTNTGTKNNGQPGDVIIAWFKPLDESFDGPTFNNEIYFMVVNGLTDPAGTAADCAQNIKLNFLDTFTDVQILNAETGNLETQTVAVVSGRRQLNLDLNGGDAVLFKISDGAPFVGLPTTDAPVITLQPASRTNVVGTTALFGVAASGDLPITYQWLFNGNTISGATTVGYSLHECTKRGRRRLFGGDFQFVRQRDEFGCNID